MPDSSLVIRRASGCLFGVACGDALGAPVERRSRLEMMGEFAYGPQELKIQGKVARVTDDTQLTLAVGEALMSASMSAPKPITRDKIEQSLRDAFIKWLHSPDNDRESGHTTTESCKRLAAGIQWYQSTGDARRGQSRGCGATMRVAPVGLLRTKDPAERAAIAQLQSALTHIHPTALTASDLTATAIADLVAGGDTSGLLARLRRYAESQQSVYHANWLGSLWKHDDLSRSYSSPEHYIASGWNDCLMALTDLESELTRPDDGGDVSLKIRFKEQGHTAHSAFGIALLCFLRYSNEPLSAIRRAAFTDGDSDTIAALAGAFAGAYLGIAAWPTSWLNRIEYHQRLSILGEFWD